MHFHSNQLFSDDTAIKFIAFRLLFGDWKIYESEEVSVEKNAYFFDNHRLDIDREIIENESAIVSGEYVSDNATVSKPHNFSKFGILHLVGNINFANEKYLNEITHTEAIAPSIIENSIASSSSANGPAASQRSDIILTLQRIFCGGLAGMCAKSCIAPVDRIKIMFQVTSEAFNFRRAVYMTKKILFVEGPMGLWRGNSATMIRVFPYAGTQFMIFDTLKRIILSRKESDYQSPSCLTKLESLISGSIAGVISSAVTYPLDLARSRMAVQSSKKFSKRPGVFRTLKDSIQKDGLLSLYRGLTPSLLGIVPYAGIAFSINENLKHEVHTATGVEPNTLHKLLIGAFAGLVAQSCTYPLEMVRRRMQTDGILNHKEGISQLFEQSQSNQHIVERPGLLDTAKLVVREHGLRGLYKGLSMNWVKGPVGISISFTTFDFFKRQLGLE